MPVYGWLLIGAAVAAAMVAVVLMPRAIREEKTERLSGREPMAPEHLYARYYAASGVPRDIVIESLRRVGEVLELPPELLRPSDRFDEELGPVLGRMFDDSLFGLGEESSAELDFQTGATGTRVRTLDDLIRAVAAWEAHRAGTKTGDSHGQQL